MQAFVRDGHEVFLLTQGTKGVYHERAESYGVKAFAHDVKAARLFYFIRHAAFLASFCKTHSIDVVFSHLENASLAAVLAQYKMKARVIACRHIVDEASLLGSRNFIIQNKIVYRLAKCIMVVSERSKKYMAEVEKISREKIHVLNLSYNFSLYPRPVAASVEAIRNNNTAGILLVTACRLVEPKRPDLSVEVLARLLERGIDARLIILGKGPMEEDLRKLIIGKGLENRVSLEGFRTNVIDYLAAADILLHPSVLDSSSVIIKEAALMEKCVICCTEVGDVDEYILDAENGFLVDREHPVDQMVSAVEKFALSDRSQGQKLKQVVTSRFSIENNIRSYYDLISIALK
jgi:glycosyltransferase involved in cell wall biosynthesis